MVSAGFVFCIVIVILSSVYAITEEEKAGFWSAIKPIVTECTQWRGVSRNDIRLVKESGDASDGFNSCFLGCVLKRLNVLNEQGEYEVGNGLSIFKPYIKNEADFAKLERVGKECATVNHQTVGDGPIGCERAKLLLACFLRHKAKIPF